MITAFLSTPALALDSAPDLLKRASKGRIELQTVILEIEQNLKVLRDPVTFRKYFSIVPELSELSMKLNLEQINPLAVNRLANSMAAHGSRWLKLSTDSKELILSHVKWMNATSTFRFLQYQQDLVKKLKTEEEHLMFAKNLNQVLDLIEGKFESEWYIEQGYRDLSSEVAFQRLSKLDFKTPSEHIKWMSYLKNLDTSTAYTNSLYRESLSFDVKDENSALKLMAITKAFSDYIDTNPFRLSERINSPLSSVQLELVDKAFIGSWNSDINSVLNTIESLNIEGLSFLADRWSNAVNSLIADQDPEVFIVLIKKLSLLLDNNGLNLKAQNLNKNSLPRLNFIKLTKADAEGVYQVSTDKGVSNTFTLIKSSNQTYIVSLSTNTSNNITKTFFYVTYSIEKDSYIAFQTNPSLGSSEANDYMEFSLQKDGSVSILSSAYFGSGKAVGTKVSSFKDKIQTPFTTFVENGIYNGTMTDSRGRNKKVTLRLNTYENQAFGLFSMGEHVDLDFTNGSLLENGNIHLTSSKLASGSAVHLRLVATEDGVLEGLFIVMGRNKASKLKLKIER